MTVSILFSSEPEGHGVKATIHSEKQDSSGGPPTLCTAKRAGFNEKRPDPD
jgi:hypothetical protein